MADEFKVYCKLWRSSGSSSSKVRLNAAGQKGTAFSGLPTTKPSGYNYDLTVSGSLAGQFTSGVIEGDLAGSAGTIYCEVDGATGRYVSAAGLWYNIPPSSVSANAPSTYLIPSGLRQRDEALKSIPFHVYVSGTTTSNGSWGTIGTFYFVVPGFVSGVA